MSNFRVYDDREEYLRETIKTAAIRGHALCNAILSANIPLVQDPDDEEQPNDRDTKQDLSSLPENFPWLTLVLGSGCATETIDHTSAAPISPDRIRALLGNRPPLKDGTLASEIAYKFANNLVRQRLPEQCKPDQKPADDERDHPIATLVLATALLTILYRGLAAESQYPLDARGNDRVEMPAENGQFTAPFGAQRLPELRTVYAEELAKLLKDLSGQQHQHKAVRHVLERVSSHLSEFVDRLDLQILTEFTWLALTERSTIYYGWSSLLALAARADDTKPDAPHRNPPRPGFDRSAAIDFIKKRYVKFSRQSWTQPALEHPAGRRKFFDSAAKVLIAQSELRARYSATMGALPPVASAFSTSFDIELEMSLAKHNVGFVIVVPVHYSGTEERKVPKKNGTKKTILVETTSLQWLGAVVEPDHAGKISLDQIIKPTKWLKLSGFAWEEERTGWPYANWPFIVRLAGCPVIELPGADEQVFDASPIESEPKSFRELIVGDDEELFSRQNSRLTFQKLTSAVLLDEHGAIEQYGTQMFGQSSTSNGFPEELMSVADSPVKARFWLLMGVQTGDAAIRYGIASRLGTPRTGLPPMASAPNRAGLVVSSHIDAATRDLMRRYGIDLVHENCAAFANDLDHYSDHLHIDNALRWPLKSWAPHEECFLLKNR